LARRLLDIAAIMWTCAWSIGNGCHPVTARMREIFASRTGVVVVIVDAGNGVCLD
jgi:hypothetical protein